MDGEGRTLPERPLSLSALISSNESVCAPCDAMNSLLASVSSARAVGRVS